MDAQTSIAPLAGKKIVLGITGGIAAYKSCELIRLLKKADAHVHVVMTESAKAFITETTLQALSGNPVLSSLWASDAGTGMSHIDLSRQCDAILIAPCTANFMAKLAQGTADELLSTLCLARKAPLWIAPAMNVEMWNNPATQRNLQQVQADGIAVFGPGHGEQACGEVGDGRMLEASELFALIQRGFTQPVLKGKTVLLTAGPTFEAIDPVRGITNVSSGKMGYALAHAAWLAGARVQLVSGPTALPSPYGVERIPVQSAADMLAAVMGRTDSADVFISVAAVADYAVKNRASHKLKKADGGLNTLEFVLNPDILKTVSDHAQKAGKPLCVGFAAETQDLENYAHKKLVEKNLPMVIGNIAQDTFGADEVQLHVFQNGPTLTLPRASKVDSAIRLIQLIADRLVASGKG